MTEKRFKYGSNERWESVLLDTLEKKEYEFYEVGKLCDKLWEQTQRFEKHNKELMEEIEQLKRQVGNLEHTKDFCAEVCADCERLEKENKELKEDNDIKFWKHEFMSQWNTTQLISHELYLAIENGYEISEDFKKYLDELKERHEENMKKAERLKI